MIKKLKISNFRSIKNQEIDLSKINVIYGGTGTGKSSILYSLIVLSNFIKNPNQIVDGFFYLGFLNLGGFEACVFNHEKSREIGIGYATENGEYEFDFRKNEGRIKLKFNNFEMEGNIPIPYSIFKNFNYDYKKEYTINWNGVNSEVIPKEQTTQSQQSATEIAEKLNSIPSAIDSIDIVPHRRGFFKFTYSPSKVSLIPTSEDEVASIIINDSNLPAKISVDLEKIINRDFRIHSPPGTAMVYFKTTDKVTRTPTDLVNDGFGVNQLVYMLAKIHRPEIKTILIEEPEIHLHPKVIQNLVKTIISIAKEEEKQFVIVTHSELFVSSLLVRIVEKRLEPSDVKLYLAEKEGKETIFKEQKVNEKGQVEGGLENFVSAELEDLKILLDIKE